MTVSIILGDDGETVETIYNGQKEGSDWVVVDRQLPQVEQSDVAVTWYYRGGKLEFETEPIPEDDGLV